MFSRRQLGRAASQKEEEDQMPFALKEQINNMKIFTTHTHTQQSNNNSIHTHSHDTHTHLLQQ